MVWALGGAVQGQGGESLTRLITDLLALLLIDCFVIILSDLDILVKYPALVLYYSEGAGAVGVLLGKNPPGTVTINRGNLLQYKLIHVQCTKKKVPEYRYLYRSTVIWFKKIFSRSTTRTLKTRIYCYDHRQKRSHSLHPLF